MTNDSFDPEKALAARIERLRGALDARPKTSAPVASKDVSSGLRTGAKAGVALSAALVAVAIVTGHFWLILPAILLALGSGLLLVKQFADVVLHNLPAGIAPHDPTRAHVGMGASVAGDAVLEPGAVVEMGASVGAGAVIKRGAVVRMGASVSHGAVLEAGAVVSWGSSVHENAVVGERAVVGAGASIGKNARVPPGLHVMPGADFRAATGTTTETIRPEFAVDSRAARIDAACARLETELRESTPQIREALGGSLEVAQSLRDTCRELARREAALRAESSPEAETKLSQEKATLQKRIAETSDEQIRRSLSGAVNAIDDQLRQRELLRRSADRLDAEQTRLLYTLEGMAAQLVRVRTNGLDAAKGPDAELTKSVVQLNQEIDAIADALEQVASDDKAAIAGFAEAPATFENGASSERIKAHE